jgi:signal transduction histidine kinase
MQNLVFNAIDASPAGSTVEISAVATSDQKLCLRVSDQGSGILPETESHIFEPYFTTKSSDGERRGLGLGLAICQKIIELHKGQIAVSTNPPSGAVFTATIPLKYTAGFAAEASLAPRHQRPNTDPKAGPT